ncbi:MAG: spermidine synthase [Actinomycetota bacterium]
MTAETTGVGVGSGVLARRIRLVVLSFLMLFVELALIRWTASNVVYLAFFTNFVLLASFLGIGIGFLRAGAVRDRFPLSAPALTALVAFVLLFPVEAHLGEPRFTGLGQIPALPRWLMLAVLFLGSAAVMSYIAEGVARTFVTFEPLEAYRLDVLGAVLGILAFSLLSFLEAPPVAWGVVAAATLIATRDARWGRTQSFALVALVLMLGIQTASPTESWSPYYKVNAEEHANGDISVRVNNLPHQTMQKLDRLRESQPFYFVPYERMAAEEPGEVLIVGAGTGDDVAVALAEGATRVDAVEIDPVIQRLGEERHPERPYDDPRVQAVIDDGRAFLERTQRRYDLILFALPDSLTLVGQSAVRLESYLFTMEGLGEAREHLRDDGVFAAYNYYRPHVLDRYAGTLEEVFGRSPCVDFGRRLRGRMQAVITVDDDGDGVRCAETWEPITASAVAPVTDDRPFPYLEHPRIPMFYVVSLGLILLASVFLIRGAAGRVKGFGAYLDLFWMGAAFLLLETKSVVQFALLFGTTWLVNALVFAGILLSVLAAVEVARRIRLPHPALLYALLLGALAVAWLIPTASLLALPVAVRFLAAIAVAFAPVFLANLVFAQRFRGVASSGVAFGVNLLGAMLGGVLEYGALVVGYRGLLLWVAVLYGLAFVFGRAHLGRRAAA